MGYSWNDDDEPTDAFRRSRLFEQTSEAPAGAAAGGDRSRRPQRPASDSRAASHDQLVLDIGDLVREARLRRSAASLASIWTRLLSLRTWFFLAERSLEGRPGTARVVERRGRRSVLIFTDELGAVHHQMLMDAGTRGDAPSIATPQSQQAPQASPSQPLGSDQTTILIPDPCRTRPGIGGGPDSSSAPPLQGTSPPLLDAGLELDLESAGEVLEQAAMDGVFSALFDVDDEAFEIPLGVLLPLAARRSGDLRGLADATLLHGLPAGRVDFASLFELAARAPSARAEAIDALLDLRDWWFICNPRQPDAIFVRRVRDRPMLMVFTDQRRAIAATRSLGVADRDGTILLLQLATDDSIGWLPAFVAEGVEQAGFDAVSGGLVVGIEELRTRFRERAGPG